MDIAEIAQRVKHHCNAAKLSQAALGRLAVVGKTQANKLLTPKTNILCALFLSVVNPLGVIGNRRLPPEDPRKKQRRHNRCIRFYDKFWSIER